MRLSSFANLVGASAVVLFANSTNAQLTIHPIVLEGYNVPGVGNIPSGFGASENFAVNNSGQWIVEADTDNANTAIDGVIVKGTGFSLPPLALHLQHGQLVTLPAGANISSFDSATINNSGNNSYNHFLGNTGAGTNDSGIYFNNTLLIQESNISTATGFSANTPYIGWFETYMNNSNQIFMIASVDDSAIASTVDRALVRVDQGPFAETVYAKEGDLFFGFAAAEFGTGPHTTAFNDSAQALYSVDTTDASTTTDGGIFRDDGTTRTLLAREGSPSAVAGRNWGTLIGVALDMNNSGDWAMRGDIDGATTDDSMIVKNGTAVIAREGASLPAIGGVFTFTSFGSGNVQISDAGDVFWVGDWNDPDTTKDIGIFMNDNLLVQEGVTLVDGIVLASISAVESNFRISDSGEWLIFEGVLANGLDGAFLVQVPEPTAISLLALGACVIGRRRRGN
jgi:hypothetical protein